jgi:hypothetical protein
LIPFPKKITEPNKTANIYRFLLGKCIAVLMKHPRAFHLPLFSTAIFIYFFSIHHHTRADHYLHLLCSFYPYSRLFSFIVYSCANFHYFLQTFHSLLHRYRQ